MTSQSALDFAARMPKYAVTEKTATPRAQRVPEVNPLRACRLTPRNGDESRRAILCDGCTFRLSHAIDGEPDPEDGLRGVRVWKSLTAACEVCWRSMRRPKTSEREQQRWSEE